jgi:chromosomal replication initiation ATPase DnaA
MGTKKQRELYQLSDAEAHIKKCYEYAERGIEEIKMSEFSDMLNRILLTKDILVNKFNELYPNRRVRKPYSEQMADFINEIFDEYFPKHAISKREQPYVWHRQTYCYFMRKYTALSFKKIGEKFGYDHSSICHSENVVKKELACETNVYTEIIDFVEDKIKEKLHQITIQTENHD